MTEDDERHGTTAGYNAHYRAGTPLCEPCLVSKRQQGRENRLKRLLEEPARASQPCGWCGRPTTSMTRVCIDCRGIELRLNVEPTYEHGLYGGSWVPNGRGTQVWQPSDYEAAS